MGFLYKFHIHLMAAVKNVIKLGDLLSASTYTTEILGAIILASQGLLVILQIIFLSY